MVIEHHHHRGSSTSSRLGEFLPLLESLGFVYQLFTDGSPPVMPPGTFDDTNVFATRAAGRHATSGDGPFAS